MQRSRILLAIFVVLTLIFALTTLYEATNSSGPARISTATATQTVIVGNQTPQAIPVSGSITLRLGQGDSRTFQYVMWNQSTPNTFTFYGVRFSVWTNTTVTNTAGSCFGPVGGYGGYVIGFTDGSSERLSTCTVGGHPPISIVLTNHTLPQAGFLIIPTSAQILFLVSQ